MKLRVSNPFISHIAALAALLATSSVYAASGTWLGNANWWSDPASWVSGTIADGTDSTANFTGVNLTGNIDKPLGGSGNNRTIGNIIFTDTTPSHNLTLSTNTLTLDVSSGQPNIDVTQTGRTLTISSTVAGNDGLQKSGLGTLTLSGNNTFTGNILISSGTLSADRTASGANPTTGALGNTQVTGRTATVSSGGTLNFNKTDVMGDGGSSPQLTLIANDGGIIKNTGAVFNLLGPVQLNGGTLSSTGGAAAAFPSFALAGTVTVGGSAVSTISTSGTNSQMGLQNGGTTFDVADAVSGSGSDLNVTGVLAGWNSGTGSLIKTGAGTMTLSSVNTYTGGTRIDNGTLSLTHATNTLDNAGAVNVNGGTLALGTNTDTVGAVTLTSGSITGTGTGRLTGAGSAFDVRSGTISAKLGGSVGLTKSTAGTVTISSDNSVGGYTGATNVTNGKLVINGNISTSSLTTIGAAGTLGGSGTVGKTIVNGTLAVGNSPGQMNFTDTLGLNGSTVMEIDGTLGAGVTGGHDFVNLTGAGAAGVLTYGGSMTLDMGVIFGVGTYSWNLFDMASETGTFTSISLADQYLGNLLDADLNGVWDLTSGSNTWQFTESTGVLGLNVVPEPSTALLGGLGVLALLRRRRN